MISVYYALFVSVFIYKTIKLSEIPAVFMESLKTIAPILFVLSAAVSFGRVLALMNVPQMVGTWITSSFSSKWTILLVVNIFLLFVGMVMDAAPAILILTPILAPVMTAIGWTWSTSASCWWSTWRWALSPLPLGSTCSSPAP